MTTLSMPVTAETGAAPSFHNLLVAVDPACDTQHLLAVAAGVAERFNSEVSLVHVIADDEIDLSDPAARINLRADSENSIRQCAAQMKVRNRPCHTYVKVGDIVTEVRKMVRQKHIDMVIVGSSGMHGLKKVRLGSVAEGILRTVDCPVLTVGPDVPGIVGKFELRKILFPCALNAPVEAACHQVEAVASRDSHVAVLHALPRARRFSPSAPALAERYEAKMRSQFPCKGKSFVADYIVKFGSATEAILEVAHTWEADLIILPAKRGGTLVSHLPGHIAYEVIRKAPCPVLTVRV